MKPNEPLQETVYSPDALRRQGIGIWRTMITEMWQSRELILTLIYRDLSVRYRQSVLGYVWAVAPQIVTVAIFAFLASHRVFAMGETSMPYVIHALWSLSVWQLFAGCLIGSTNCLVNAGSLVTKINFPKESLVFASIGQAVFDFLIRLVPVFAVFIWYGFVPSWHSIWIPFILLSVVLMALGLGFVLAIVNLVLRDIGNAVSMLLTFGMFLAPILYPPPVHYPFYLVNFLNPFSPLLIATQDLLAGTQLFYPDMVMAMVLLSGLVFLIGWRIFHITMPRIAERA